MKSLFTAAAVLVVAISLSGCANSAGSEGAESSGLTLAATKSPAQLLRNEILTRVPKKSVETLVTEDISKGCDGDDKVRSWHSSANAEMTDSSETAFIALVRTLRVSFEDQGWTWKAANSRPGDLQGTLTSKKTAAKIFINATAPSGGANPTLLVTAAGPCVMTDGPESDEVVKLENRD